MSFEPVSTTDYGYPKLLVAETPYYKNCKYHNFVNARRIAACVNACAGIPTEELEARIKGHNA